ncbi:MAG: O-antigen ligase family protein [Bacteroidota bacterium]
MSWIAANRLVLLIVAAASALFLGVWLYIGDLNRTALLLTLTCACLAAVGLLMYAFKWYYLVLIGLIPISLDRIIAGGAKLNLPSEGLLLLAIPVLLFFNKGYSAGVQQAMRHPITRIIGLLFVIEFFSGLLGSHVDVSLKRLAIQLVFFFGFYLIIQTTSTKKQLVAPFLAYAIGLIPVMAFTLFNHASLDFQPQVVFSICQPYYNDHTIYGACLAFIIPLLIIVVFQNKIMQLTRLQKILLGVLLFVIVVSEVLALSRAALLSLVVAALFYVLLRYKISFNWLMTGLTVMVIGVWSFSDAIYARVEKNESVSNDGQLVNHFSSVVNIKNDASNLERINRWICAYRMFEDRPWLGFGPGTYQFEYNRYQTVANKTYISTNAGNRGNAHSEYLSFLSETGILGFLGFMALVLTSLYYGMQNHYRVTDLLLKRLNLGVLLGLITYYFHAVFNSFLDQNKMAFLVYASLGVIVWINLTLRNGSEKTVQESN